MIEEWRSSGSLTVACGVTQAEDLEPLPSPSAAIEVCRHEHLVFMQRAHVVIYTGNPELVRFR